MRFDFSGERVLAVVAHPDDAELLCAGTLGRARDDGAAVGICVMCQGDRGQTDPPTPNLAEVREREMQAAAALLGGELHQCGYGDAALLDDLPARAKLTDVLRAFRPTLVLAHWPGDYHPDHQAASKLAEAATWFAASRGHSSTLPPLAESPALWWMDTVNMAGFEPAFYVDVSPHMQLKRQMLACHASQVGRAGQREFAPLTELMDRQAAARGAQAGVESAEAFRQHLAFKRGRAW